jgi:hypothetical protein
MHRRERRRREDLSYADLQPVVPVLTTGLKNANNRAEYKPSQFIASVIKAKRKFSAVAYPQRRRQTSEFTQRLVRST